MNKKERILFAASTVGTILVIILASAQILGIMTWASNLYMPIIGLVLLCQTELNKDKNSSVSKICMVSAVIIFAVLLLNLILNMIV